MAEREISASIQGVKESKKRRQSDSPHAQSRPSASRKMQSDDWVLQDEVKEEFVYANVQSTEFAEQRDFVPL